MESMERCPRCGKNPELVNDRGQTVISCPEHGHMAMGDTREQAIAHWNHYIALMRTVA